MADLVRTICPRCDGNSFIRVQEVEMDCPMCEEEFMHLGMKVTTHNGYVMLPVDQTRTNVEGGIESKTKWSRDTLPEVGK